MSLRALSIFFVFASNILLVAPLFSQQLYINSIEVKYRNGGNGSCSDVTGVDPSVSFISNITGDPWQDSSRIESDQPQATYPGACLALCAQLTCVSNVGAFGVDELVFDIFQFSSGGNPLDPASTPPIRSISMYNMGACQSVDNAPAVIGGPGKYFCAAWDGSRNIGGMLGKVNGAYGFRAKVRTNQVSATVGNISIEQTSAFPGQNQIPIQLDLERPSLVGVDSAMVGQIFPVPAQPYTILYQLSDAATVTIRIFDAAVAHQAIAGSMPFVRTVVSSQPRTGEIVHEDYWDGRNDLGRLVPAGEYMARIDAAFPLVGGGLAIAAPVTSYFSVPPFTITDISASPLLSYATDVARINHVLTEHATVYLNIYAPGSILNSAVVPPILTSGSLIRQISEQKSGRLPNYTSWDGRDQSGNPVCDGEYVYALYAEIPSSGTLGAYSWESILTTYTITGVLPVSRGSAVSALTPSSTVMGSQIQVAGLDPFRFRFTPKRDTTATLNIKPISNETIIRNLITNEAHLANVPSLLTWDGTNNSGVYLTSGTYLAELITNDPYQCSAHRISTITVAIPVNLFRVINVEASGMLLGTDENVSVEYELSQPMEVALTFYSTSSVVNPTNWPPSVSGDVVYSTQILRSGRTITTEHWDARNEVGLLSPPGRYPFTLVARTTSPAQAAYAVDKTYGYVDLIREPLTFTAFDVLRPGATMLFSNDTVRLPPYTIEYSINYPSSVTIQALTPGPSPQVVATVLSSSFTAANALHRAVWDGRSDAGHYLPAGSYEISVVATEQDVAFVSSSAVSMSVDLAPLRVYDLAVRPVEISSQGYVAYQVSEPMRTVLKICKPGTIFDAQLNPTVATNLVRTIVRDVSARTPIKAYWDGRDESGQILPDANYIFKLAASTEPSKISEAGVLSAGIALSPDVIQASIPLNRGEVLSSSTYVSTTEETSVVLAQNVMEIRVNIDPGTFSQAVTVSITTTTLSTPVEPGIKVSPVSIQIINNLNLQPNRDIELSINYADSDIAGMDEAKLAIGRYNPVSRNWVVLDSTLYPNENRVVAWTNHLSVFSLIQPSATTSLAGVRIYPNPYNPNRHVNGMKFTNLPTEADIKIYSINGERVRAVSYTTQNGIAQWDGRNDSGGIVASGVYMVLIKSDFNTKTFKIAIQK